MTTNEAILERALTPVVQIPMAKIRPSASNPRKIKDPEYIALLAASLKASGLENAIKVRKLTPEELAADGDHEFELVGGEGRYLAAKSLGWETIAATALTLDPVKSKQSAALDNRRKEMHWFDKLLEVEDLWKTGLYPNQQALGDALGVTQARISYSLTVAEALTPASRELIYNAVIKSGSKEDITERPIRVLTDLEVPQKIETALKVALDRKLTEAQAKKLVEWVKAGNEAQGFESQKPKTTPHPDLLPQGAKGSSKTQDSSELKTRVQEAANGGKPLTLGETMAVAVHGVKQGVQHLQKSATPSPSATSNHAPVLHLADLTEAAGKTLVWAFKNFLLPLSMKLLTFARQTVFGVAKLVISQVKSLVKGLWHFLRGASRKAMGFLFYLALLAFVLSVLADTVFHGEFNLPRAFHGFIGGIKWLLHQIRL